VSLNELQNNEMFKNICGHMRGESQSGFNKEPACFNLKVPIKKDVQGDSKGVC
jgi:hypothetical protein